MHATDGIMETAIYIRDLDAAEVFYRRVFGLEVVLRIPGKFVFFRCAASMLLIFDPDESTRDDPRNPIPRHGAEGAGHFCFRVEDAEAVGAWRDRFARLGIAVERYHVWEGSGAHSVYIRDPGDNSVEVAERRLWGLD